jgi:putative membrane-bound dehydrogenase-like protein
MNMSLSYRFLACWLFLGALALGEGRRIEVLFLGDKGHHKPEERVHELTEALGPRGFNITYTENLDDLNRDYLARYDGLMIYANIGRLDPEKEQVLLDYVASGKGLIPIHCASYCFLNSKPYIALVGAQFKSHKTGVFTAEIVKPDHPAMKNVEPFEAWDETYVHHQHNDDRVVLMERVEGDRREPWTWVRTHGKGRVFYTASGHDQRCWTHAGFHQLIESGTLWAIGEAAASEVRKLAIQPREYEVRDTVQNYERRKVPLKYQLPLSPEEAQKHIQVPVGFEAQLYASEPDIRCPMSFTWDERGRLWVLESMDYPNKVIADRKGRDRITICEDSDGDGKADTFKVFAEGLNIPTGMVRVRDGVLVAHAPEFVYYEDTDGDDKADRTRVVNSGWGRGDTHGGPSNLRFGLDNYLWGCVGYSSFNGEVGGLKKNFGRGLYRFNLEGTFLEFVAQFSNNSWGLGFGETGDIFGSTANNTHHMHIPVPIRYYEKVKGMGKGRGQITAGGEKLDSHFKMHATTPNIRQVDVHKGYTAAAGHNMYTARTYPKAYWNRVALVCEPTGGLVHRGILEPKGAGYVEPYDGWNLISSSDEWFSPIHAEVGPDGQVWVADWYNFIIQHNPTPSLGRGGFAGKNGKGNAHENPLRDEQHGRIYRVVYTAGPTSKITRLDRDKPAQLVAALANDNMFWRQTAQRLLVERGDVDVVPGLIEQVKHTKQDELGLTPGAIHALWTLKGLGVLDGNGDAADQAAVEALRHPSAAVRKNAALVLPNTPASARAIVASGILNDSNLNTRAGALLALSDQPESVEAGAHLHAIQKEVAQGDRFVDLAHQVAVAKHASGYLKAELAGLPDGLKAPPKTKLPKEVVGPNLFPNPSFETVSGKLPKGWKVRHYRGSAKQEVVKPGHSGSHSMFIQSDSGADTSLMTMLTLEPNSRYRMSAWIKTEGVKGGTGALLNVHEQQRSQGLMKAVTGTHDWQRASVEFDTSSNEGRLSFNLLFGGWGLAKGKAWYDDVELVRIGKAKGGGGVVISDGSKALGIAVQNIGSRSLAVLKEGLSTADRAKLEAKAADWGMGSVAKDPVGPAVDVTLHLSVIKDIIKYDKAVLEVPAGKKIKLIFENPDHMQHNWLLVKPGQYEAVGALADQMLVADAQQAMSAEFIPDSSTILVKSGLLAPGTIEEIIFTAPATPGDYPYLCTFPGHWRIMHGVLRVR